MASVSRLLEGRPIRLLLSAFILASCLRAWFGPVTIVDSAQAQIPDSAMQRKRLLDEARRTNQLLSEISQILTSGTLNVRLTTADKPGADN